MLDSFGRQKLRSTAQVIVDVDHRKQRLLDDGGLGDHHGARLPIAQLQLLDVALVLGEKPGGEEYPYQQGQKLLSMRTKGRFDHDGSPPFDFFVILPNVCDKLEM